MSLRTLTILSLLLACSPLPAQNIEATGDKPAPLTIDPPAPKPGSLIRWLGHEGSSPEGVIGGAEWTPDGTRLLTSRRHGTPFTLQVWKASNDRKSVSLEG
ncbi:MAG: hypothetical protein ACAH88_18205, partial [Roseimicrobium sp.]